MDVQLWSKAEEKRAVILALRGDEIHCLEVTGNKARQEAARIMGALQQGQEPSALGANSSSALKVGSIGRRRSARTTCSSNSIPKGRTGNPSSSRAATRRAPRSSGRSSPAPADRSARRSRTSRRSRPWCRRIIIGVIIGFFWTMVYWTAGEMAAARQGDRGPPAARRGLKQMFVFVAGMLGVNGTLVLGVVLLLAIIGWATMRVVRRPATDRLAARAGVISLTPPHRRGDPPCPASSPGGTIRRLTASKAHQGRSPTQVV